MITWRGWPAGGRCSRGGRPCSRHTAPWTPRTGPSGNGAHNHKTCRSVEEKRWIVQLLLFILIRPTGQSSLGPAAAEDVWAELSWGDTQQIHILCDQLDFMILTVRLLQCPRLSPALAPTSANCCINNFYQCALRAILIPHDSLTSHQRSLSKNFDIFVGTCFPRL